MGWEHNGEYTCDCGTSFGKNLLGDKPYSLVREHVHTCVANAVGCLARGYREADGKPPWYEEATWREAVKIFAK